MSYPDSFNTVSIMYGTIFHMKKMKKLIIGNWKMNPTSLAEAKKLAGDVKKGLKLVKNTNVVMCPPFVYLGPLTSIPSNKLFFGAQNASAEASGSFTGEVSHIQLLDFKVSHVILGHSETRARGETDQGINKKVRAVTHEGMTAVLCIGESQRDKEGNYLHHLKNQIHKGLEDVSKKSLPHVVIAYEPVWAIGAKYAMTPSDVHETSIFIRKILRDMYGPVADDVQILYGGSVDSTNALEIVRDGFISGLLIGRESLKAKNFLEIINQIDVL